MDQREGGDGMTYQDIVTLVSVVGAIVAMVFAFKNSHRQDDQQTREDAGRLARIEGKLDNANRGIDDVRVEVRTHSNQISAINASIAQMSSSLLPIPPVRLRRLS